jgi:hypothetical protein
LTAQSQKFKQIVAEQNKRMLPVVPVSSPSDTPPASDEMSGSDEGMPSAKTITEEEAGVVPDNSPSDTPPASDEMSDSDEGMPSEKPITEEEVSPKNTDPKLPNDNAQPTSSFWETERSIVDAYTATIATLTDELRVATENDQATVRRLTEQHEMDMRRTEEPHTTEIIKLKRCKQLLVGIHEYTRTVWEQLLQNRELVLGMPNLQRERGPIENILGWTVTRNNALESALGEALHAQADWASKLKKQLTIAQATIRDISTPIVVSHPTPPRSLVPHSTYDLSDTNTQEIRTSAAEHENGDTASHIPL